MFIYYSLHRQTLASTISCGGNILMNIGPTKDGIIAPIFQERLKQIGSWLKVNGEAVYSSVPWRSQNDTLTPHIWYTSKKSAVYVFIQSWPKDDVLSLGSPVPMGPDSKASLLGWSAPLEWKRDDKVVDITLPDATVNELPCQWSWVIKLENFK